MPSDIAKERIIYAMTQYRLGVSVAGICRKMDITRRTFYAWKKKHAKMTAGEDDHLEDENRELKKMVACLTWEMLVLLNAAERTAP